MLYWRNLESRYEEHMRHMKNKELNKSAVAAHFWCHKHKFEEEPKLLKHISNRPLSELLIYKDKEVVINFDIPKFNDLFKLMVVRGRSCPLSIQAAVDEVKCPCIK